VKLLTLVVAVVLFCAVPGAQDAPMLTPTSLEAALAAKPDGVEAERLADRIRTYFGGSELLAKGPAPEIDELTVAWALEVRQLPPNAPPPRVVSDVVHFTMPLTKVGSSGLYAGVSTLSHGSAFSWHYEAGDRRLGGGQLEVYEIHPDSREKPGVPKGTTKQMPAWESKIFSGTRRDWWVYVPAQYKPESPAAVMVFQDGNSYRDSRSTTTGSRAFRRAAESAPWRLLIRSSAEIRPRRNRASRASRHAALVVSPECARTACS